MPLLQFTPLPSRPSPSFWSSLSTLKLDTLKLDDSPRPVTGYLEEGRSVRDSSAAAAGEVDKQDEEVWIGGCLSVDGSSFEGSSETPPSNAIPLQGTFRNFNTIEDFKSADAKKAMFAEVVDQIYKSWLPSSSTPPIFNPFLLLTFSDLKKYRYTYQFAFPVLVQKPAWEIGVAGSGEGQDEGMMGWEGDVSALRQARSQAGIQGEAFLVKEDSSGFEVAEVKDYKAFFDGVLEEKRTLVFHDPSTLANTPGWTLRNILHYLALTHGVLSIRVIALRSGPAASTRVFSCHLSGPVADVGKDGAAPQAVGWERNAKGAIVAKVADLGGTMDPKRLADQAVDLNLKLMRWRVMPNLNLEKIAATKVLLLGAGTLGCYVSRCLMGWGVRNITFVDSAKVSFSNPVRQPLFDFEDCLDGGKPKAQCAADSLKKIFPGINSTGIDMLIPMPGHPVAPAAEESVAASVKQLEDLMASHDAVFLLMDSRESRWLPTLIGASMGKIVINAALGFDSWLVMRHGVPEPEVPVDGRRRLGCYYCNDVVAPTDSLTDRTLDQMCTVTRPGIAPIAAASAVELLVSLLQHPDGVDAPADLAPTPQGPNNEPQSVLGLVPHQLRGFLAQYRTMLIEGAAYEQCTGCSPTVINEYRTQGFKMLLRAFNEGDYLEKLTGLDKVQAEGEAALEAVDWDEGSDEGSM